MVYCNFFSLLNNINAYTAFYNLKLLMWERENEKFYWSEKPQKNSHSLWISRSGFMLQKPLKEKQKMWNLYVQHIHRTTSSLTKKLWMNELIERGRIFKYSSRRVVACWHGNLSLQFCNNFSEMNVCADNLIEPSIYIIYMANGRW